MAAGRKQLASNNKVAAAAVAVALVAMLLVAPAAVADDPDCGVDGNTMRKCMSYCSSGGDSSAICDTMRKADLNCLCKNYWNKYKSMPFITKCAGKIKNDCGISHSC